jgi:hypothetical protein
MTLFGVLYDKVQIQEKRGQPEKSEINLLHKFDPKSLEQLKEVMKNETAKKLEESRAKAREQLKK